MGMIFILIMMVALLNNQNYPSAHAIALTQRNDLNQLIQGMGHMWLEGYPNPYKMEQSWERTFLRLFTHTNPKSASKIIFTS